MTSIMLSVRRLSSRKEGDEEATDAADLMNARYQECVEEIKMENVVMGSLQLHNEAMRRLNERQQNEGGEFAPDKVQPRANNRRVSDRFRSSLALSLKMDELTRSLHETVGVVMRRGSGRRLLGETGRSGSGPMDEMIVLGRRGSTLVEESDLEAVLSTSMFQDIELSDSDESEHEEDEEESSPPASQGEQTRGSGGPSRRRSFIRRTSSLLGGRMRRRRRSSQSSISYSSNPGGDILDKARCDSDKNKKEDEKVDEGKTCSDSSDDLQNRRSSTGDGGEKVPRRSSTLRARRTGRRRSSLFSVNEHKASINNGNVGEQSSFGGSIGNSMTDGSLKGSFSGGGNRRGSLICSFNRKNSLGSSFGSIGGDDDSLICGWGRQQSGLSNTENNDANSIKSNRSLICGWDQSSNSILSNSVNSLDLSIQENLKDEDEKVLLQAKETCTLFDVRKEKDEGIC